MLAVFVFGVIVFALSGFFKLSVLLFLVLVKLNTLARLNLDILKLLLKDDEKNNSIITIMQIAALQVTGLVTMVFYIFSNKKQGYYFYYFGVDGLMILSALLTTVVSI